MAKHNLVTKRYYAMLPMLTQTKSTINPSNQNLSRPYSKPRPILHTHVPFQISIQQQQKALVNRPNEKAKQTYKHSPKTIKISCQGQARERLTERRRNGMGDGTAWKTERHGRHEQHRSAPQAGRREPEGSRIGAHNGRRERSQISVGKQQGRATK